MESFRNFWQSMLGKVLLSIVLFLFVVTMFWTGAPPAGSQGELVKVNKTRIYKEDVDRALEVMVANYGGQIDRRTLEKMVGRDKLLADLISQQAALDAAIGMKLVAGPALLQDVVRGIEAFQDEQGRFSEVRFRQALAANGYRNPAEFYARIERELLSSQLQGALVDSAFATRQDLELLTRIGGQKRDLAWVQLLPGTLLQGLSATDEEVQVHYDANTTGYMTEETFGVDYLELKLDRYAADVEIEDADIRAKYDAMVAQAQTSAERRVAHILVSTAGRSAEEAKARADEVLAKLTAGESFAKLAGEYSDDPGSSSKGGDLGFLANDVLEPSLAKAVAALRVGDVSPVVVSASGLHVLKVLEISQVQVPSLASSRAEIETGLRRDRARASFNEAADELGNLAYESDSLQEPADKLGLKVQSTGLFGRNGGPGILGNAKVMEEVLSPEVLEDQRNSRVINVGEGHVVVVHLREHHPAARRPLAEVAAQVRAEVLHAKASALVAGKAKAVSEALAAGRSLDEVAREERLVVQRQAGVQRGSRDLPGELLKAAFSLKAPAADAVATGSASLPAGGQVVFTVANVVDGTLLGTDEETLLELRSRLANDFGRLDYARFVAAALADADIERAAGERDKGIIDLLKDIKEKARRPGA